MNAHIKIEAIFDALRHSYESWFHYFSHNELEIEAF